MTVICSGPPIPGYWCKNLDWYAWCFTEVAYRCYTYDDIERIKVALEQLWNRDLLWRELLDKWGWRVL